MSAREGVSMPGGTLHDAPEGCLRVFFNRPAGPSGPAGAGARGEARP
jgi:hypothetical protein